MKQIQKECRIDFYDYVDSKFLFNYSSQGEDVVLEVTIVDYDEEGIEFHLNDLSVGLTPEDFIECEDIDDCALVIAKHIIKDNDGEVLTTFVNDCNTTLTGLIYEKRLTKELEYDKGNLDDNSWQVTLYANSYDSISSYKYYDIPQKDIAKLVELISTNNSNALYDALLDYDCETSEVFDFWDYSELSYKIFNSNEEVIQEGVIDVYPNNLFPYKGCNKYQIVNENYHPEYLLMISDKMKYSSATFNVPKNFQIGEIHFTKTRLAPFRILDWEKFGDYTIPFNTFRYRGKTYVSNDFDNAGSYGEDGLAIFKWNYDKKCYDILAEM